MLKTSTGNLQGRTYMINAFSDFAPKKIKLNDIVVCYNDGIKWKVVPLNIMNQYPILYDEYHENNSDVRIIVTIYVCPYTLFSCIYFGKYELHDKMYNNNLTLVNTDNNIWVIPILNKVYSLSTDENINMYLRKGEVKILSLKNVVYMFPDSLFIDITAIKKKKNIVNENYLTDGHLLDNDLTKKKINGKQIIYVIEYKSKNGSDYKYSVIIPKNNSFDIVKNGFETYFHNMVEKIRIKGGIIYPCLWFAWKENNIKSKIIEL